MTMAIEAVGLTKYYGDTPGIIDLNLEVETGEIFGFLGPNGAGKSTTIRTLLDLLHPSSGTATILGFDSHTDSVEIRRRAGYLPGDLSMYDHMTAREMLRYFSSLRGIETSARVEELARPGASNSTSTGRSGPTRAETVRRSGSCKRSCMTRSC